MSVRRRDKEYTVFPNIVTGHLSGQVATSILVLRYFANDDFCGAVYLHPTCELMSTNILNGGGFVIV